jgi:hypothetical protein
LYHEVKHPVPLYDPQMYSHKSNEPALAYEVSLSLHRMNVISIRGPFKVSMFSAHLQDLIPDGRFGIADTGYHSAAKLSTPSTYNTPDVKE